MKLLLACLACVVPVFSIVKFENAMEEGYHPDVYKNSKKFAFYYKHNNYEKAFKSQEPLIPKIIHQIWIGGKVPEKFKALMQSWQDKHPDWEYKLWTDQEVELFVFEDKTAFLKAKNMGSKADILRYEILYKYGGIYVDCDFECIKPLDPFIYAHEFFAGIAGFDYLGNAIIGAKPGLSIFKKLSQIMNSWNEEQLNCPWANTGPLIFTRQVWDFIKRNPHRCCIYPIKFFHPFPNTYRYEYWQQKLPRDFIESFFIEETFAVHYWAESWVEKK